MNETPSDMNEREREIPGDAQGEIGDVVWVMKHGKIVVSDTLIHGPGDSRLETQDKTKDIFLVNETVNFGYCVQGLVRQ